MGKSDGCDPEDVQEDRDYDRECTDLLEQVNRAKEDGRTEEELGLISELMALVANWAENEVPSLHVAVRMEAHDRETAADWAGAEAAYRRALEIGGDNPHWRYKGHDELRRLYVFLGRHQDALEEARAAVEAGRDAIGILHAQALVCQALVHLRMGQAAAARDLVTQSLSIQEADRLSDWMTARALAVRARCHVELEDNAAARDDLDAAWRLLEPQSAMAVLPGVQAAFGAWWHAEACLRRRQGDANGCVKAWREVVLSRRWNAGQPQLAGPYVQSYLAKALDQLGQAHESAGDRVAAEVCTTESHAIRQQIEHPHSPAA